MAKPSACDVDARRSAEAERRRARFEGFGSDKIQRHNIVIIIINIIIIIRSW